MRIFYKGSTRNGTYITDDFADKLIASLPYAPIKGIYDYEDEDFTDHGKKRSLGRIYGVVPHENNFAWETHMDKDGVERQYACSDVLLYTALYQESTQIVGKPLSMELFKNAVKGEWRRINGAELFVYSDGCFLGLQVLGEQVEPCFEGASFYSLNDAFKSLLNDVYEYDLKNNSKGENEMFNFNTEDKRYPTLWSALNPSYTEEGNWKVENNLYQVADEYVLANPIGTSNFYQYGYTTTTEGEGDNIISNYQLGEQTNNYTIMLVSEDEKAAIESIKEANGGSYENFTENFVKKEDSEQKILELNDTISTLQTEKDNSVSEYTKLKEAYDQLQAEHKAATDKVEAYELAEKQAVIDKYAKKLDEEVLNTYKENLSNYTLINLNKDLAYELVKAEESSIFSEGSKDAPIPKDDKVLSGLEAALSKHL